MYHEVVSKDGGTEHKRGLAMDDQTKNTIKQAIAHIHSNIDTYEDAIGQDPTYDDERILGSDDWSMTAFSHDLLRIGYEGHNHKAHLMLAYNQNAENVQYRYAVRLLRREAERHNGAARIPDCFRQPRNRARRID